MGDTEESQLKLILQFLNIKSQEPVIGKCACILSDTVLQNTCGNLPQLSGKITNMKYPSNSSTF